MDERFFCLTFTIASAWALGSTSWRRRADWSFFRLTEALANEENQ